MMIVSRSAAIMARGRFVLGSRLSGGRAAFGFSAAKHHLSLSPWSTRVIEDFKVRLGKFVVKQNLFQIPVDWEIDRELVKDLVRARLAELD